HIELAARIRSRLLPATAVALIMATLVLLISAVRLGNLPRALPLYASAALGGALLVGLFMFAPAEQSIQRFAVSRTADASGSSSRPAERFQQQNRRQVDHFTRNAAVPAPAAPRPNEALRDEELKQEAAPNV